MKDNFSKQAGLYAKFRPTYPSELFDFIVGKTPNTVSAWDCGTGNGQVAAALAPHFEKVFATDISEKQLQEATPKPNIFYSRQAAEQTDFPDHTFDLVTVAQAIHWFHFDRFYSEVRRTLVTGGLLAVIGYGMFRSLPEVDELVADFYRNTVGPFWDPERRYIDDRYLGLPFPFQELDCPQFDIRVQWTLPQLTGYLSTWSAVQHFIDHHGTHPVEPLARKLEAVWPSELVEVSFPILLRLGKV